MKITGLVVLGLFIAVLGLAPIADAAPSENGVIHSNGQAGANAGGWQAVFTSIKEFLAGKPGNHGNAAPQGGLQSSSGYQGTTLSQTASTQSVPAPGTLLLFGGGFAAFALWHQRSRRGLSA